MTEQPAGPPAVAVPADAWRRRAAKVPGSRVALITDDTLAGADLYTVVNVLEPGATIPLHWHSVGELQFVLAGHGLFLDAAGGEAPLSPHDSVFSPPGPAGAHGFRNPGHLQLALLCVYPSPGGRAPDIQWVTSLVEDMP